MTTASGDGAAGPGRAAAIRDAWIRLVRHGVAARYQHALTRSVVTSLSALEAPALLA